MARRQDLLEIVYANGMRRRVKKHTPVPHPLVGDLMYQMNRYSHRVIDRFC